MKIVGSELQLASSHASTQHHEINESLRVWIGNRRPDFEGRGSVGTAGNRRPAVDQVTLSQAGKTAHAAEAEAIDGSAEQAENDPRLMLLRAMIYLLTGKEARVFDPAELDAPAAAPDMPTEALPTAQSSTAPPARAAGYGLEYDRHESYTESEQTTFSASGVVRTADGREISFQLNLSMARSYHEESDVSVRLGDARQRKDPLVLNFTGTAAQLSDQRFSFDLDANGSADSVNLLAGGSGFLALDRNGDGKINDGSELFGTRSGNGFADLAALDGDSNGWIDENDAAYAQLRVWTPAATGDGSLRDLKAANVGALSLAQVATPFALKDGNNGTLGQIRSSGIFLQESGEAGTIQQVDLSV